MNFNLWYVGVLIASILCYRASITPVFGQTGGPAMETRSFGIQPGVFKSLPHFPVSKGDTSLMKPEIVQYLFEGEGVPFPSGSSVIYNDHFSQLTVRNTKENLDLFEKVVKKLNLLPCQVTIEARFLRMPRETAEDLFKPEVNLSKVSIVREDVLRRTRDLVRQKEITVLAQPKVATVSGNTAQIKSVEEFRYATDYSFVPPFNTNKPATTAEARTLLPGSFETRELGTLLNVTPTLGPDGQTINLTLVPEISTKGEPPTKVEAATPAGKVSVEQPRFRSRQVTTTVQILSGSTILLGVADPIEGEDRDQIVLVLLTATVVYLQ